MKKQLIGVLMLCSSSLVCQAQLPLLQAENTYFVRADIKQKVVLKGIDISNNVWGFYEWPVSDSLEKAKVNPLIRAREVKPFLFNSEDVERIATLDLNVVRYCFNDELFRADNVKRQSNLVQIRSHISQLAAKGIYSIVTMQINPGLDGHNDNYERDKPASVRLKSPFESDSVFKLWSQTWKFVAKGLEDMDAVAGYELIVEPRRPALADASEQQLVSSYLALIDTIRKEDNRHVVMVPEFNSREANPGEQYWSTPQNKMVTDKGEQGTIWERNWLKLPATTPNMAYVAHIYAPFEFTTGRTFTTFDAEELQHVVKETADWVYAQNKPLYTSEYGANYVHTMNGNNAKRMEWYKVIHDEFDAAHVSTTAWQYKEIITPWVKMEESFGLWQHYYDKTTVKGIVNEKVEFVNEQTTKAAEYSRIDQILNEYFIENGQLKEISLVANQPLMDEFNRYFNIQPLGVSKVVKTPAEHHIFADREFLHFNGLPQALKTMHVTLFELNGYELLDTSVQVSNGKAQLPVSRLNSRLNKVLLVKYGSDTEWTNKVLLP